jgi:pimeloyl-ACP methyl ester carboxylesterase
VRFPTISSFNQNVAKAVAREAGTWKFQGQHPVAYEHVPAAAQGEPVLLLNGFGMGSFHQHRLMDACNGERNLYGMDYLGQGQSWPENCDDGESDAEKGLQYSGQTWVKQIIGFIEEVCLTGSHDKVHLVGNSVGGHLAVFVAAQRPDLVKSLVLLNPTPVWGLNLPGWSGHLPAPPIPKHVGHFLFDRMRSKQTIEQFLTQTYSSEAAYDDKFIQQVRDCTEGAGGHAAFASILWSPPVSVSLPCGSNGRANFYDCLAALDQDVLLCFGRDDPWCKPAIGKRMLQTLQGRNGSATQRYVELSNVGHCAHHEAPTATARLLSQWLDATDRRRVTLLCGECFQEPWGETVVQELTDDEIPLSFVDRIVTRFV